ncbi:flagellar hook protein FlgE [Dethiosulfovibrio sp. F2B]|uniref:flagellar hook protein FlgE n=1 Tax=Dethiosulfovibrio faecalis TaxID=2720018 RepID=UPI001F3C1099|nr:flagellar hook protein FlgE [Dethiosulfovibrio faecalis]MCF4150620.1 flagellar hook protein FlgE [Dethiosulfovibrio faecalis]
MLRSLFTGVTGVKAHQVKLDVTGNNIANVNSTGFKKSTTIFQDLLSQTTRGAMAPDGNRGGVNAMQVGLGVGVAGIETIHTQGPISYTGNRTDMAIQGDGYYVVTNGTQDLYTRAGNFTTDGNGNLVMSGTGYTLQGYAMSVDPNDPTRYEMDGDLSSVNIPMGQKLEAKKTELVGYRCNLDGRVDEYLPMGMSSGSRTIYASLGGSDVAVNVTEGATTGDFVAFDFDGSTGGPITFGLDGIDAVNGRPELTLGTSTFDLDGVIYTAVYDDTNGVMTIYSDYGGPAEAEAWKANLFDMMDYQYMEVQDTTVTPVVTYNTLIEFNDDPVTGEREMIAWFDDGGTMTRRSLQLGGADGNIPMNTDGTFAIPTSVPADPADQYTLTIGTVALDVLASSDGKSIRLEDSGSQIGSVAQRTASIHEAKSTIYDSQGNEHTLETSWEKIDDNRWRWRVWTANEEISISPNTGIMEFGPDGKISDTSQTEVDLSVSFGALGAENQNVKLDFSGRSFEKEKIDGVTQYGSDFTTKPYYQDGYGMGVLNDFSVGKDGTITGVYDNGQSKALYRLALAMFSNPQGLVKVGDTCFDKSVNSGAARITTALNDGAGSIAGGSLEMSNVDLTEEFTQLMIGQRGFQASARVITTSDSVLEELLNLKR